MVEVCPASWHGHITSALKGTVQPLATCRDTWTGSNYMSVSILKEALAALANIDEELLGT